MAAELPFLVLHGSIVWKVLLAALVGGTAAVSIAIRNRRARKAASASTAELLRDARSIAEGPVCVRGVLRGGSLHTLSKSIEYRNHRDGAPWIECADGARVDIAAAGRVLAGARVTSSSLFVPKGTPRELADKRGAWLLTSVREGDEVVVRGKAKRTQEDASYREDATAWTIDDDLAITAVKPAARARPRHAIVQALLLFVVSGVWYGALQKVGRNAMARIDKRPALGDLSEIPPFGALAIACAMPRLCERAKDMERYWYFERYGRRGSAFAQYDALHGADPCGLASEQMRQVRLDAALASVRACGDRAVEAWTQVFLGDYRAALELAPRRPIVREYAAVGVGDWKIAAEAADAGAARAKESYEDIEYYARATAAGRCRAAWYRHLAGVADAFANVDVKTSTCQVFAALAKPDPAQVEMLRAVHEHERSLDYGESDSSAQMQATTLLAMHGALDDDSRYGLDIVFGVRPTTWLTTFEARPTPAVFEGRAGIAVLRGDFPAAHAAADAISNKSRQETVRTWIALREGSPPPATKYNHPAMAEQLALRAGSIPKNRVDGVYPPECKPRLVQGIEAALAGDGGRLANVFSDCNVYYIYMPELLFGILPHVQRGRAELADALRAFRHDITTYALDHVPFDLVKDLADARDLARMIGDAEEVSRLQTIIDRHTKVLGDRTRAIAMFMLTR